jgi:NOL1/NOP2/fmu family ribosome biogenesis protein
MAVLEKKNGATGEANPPFQPPQLPVESSELVHRAMARFGIYAERLAPLMTFQPGRRAVYLVNCDHQPTVRPQPDAVGMLFVKIRNRYPKLSTAASMLLGSGATRNVIDLDEDQLCAFIRRQPVVLPDIQIQGCDDRGYVLVRHRSFAMGVGVLHPHAAGASLESMFPKGWSPHGGL